MLDFRYEEKTLCTVRSYWSAQFIAGDKMEKSSDEPPTPRPEGRADQAHRVQLIARSISSASLSTALSLVKSGFVFLFTVSSKSSILKYCCILVTAEVALCCRQIYLHDVSYVVYKLSHRST